jgi:tRNA pseudouridine38-40 synthase
MQAQWEEKDHLLIFKITADRFLRNMVRAIVGTLLDVGREKISTDDFKSIIESKNRSNAGYSVPAKGLFLTEVDYPPNIFKRVPS